MHQPSFEPGQVVDGKYRIERVLGQGGMGIVYEAFHQHLAQSVALKVVKPKIGRDLETIRRFMNEARNSARIESDHVARVMDTGCFRDGTPFMVMELLVGQDLETLLAAERSMPAWRVADLLLQALEGVAAAHALGIVHRDLKPANLFLEQKPGRSARVKVLDFGISKAVGASPMGGQLTRTGAIIGSPAFVSPEQIRNSKDVDARADIWSLGVIAYELATGALPFEAPNVGALYSAILQSEPRPMRQHRADVPDELERVVRRCMRKRPEERFQSAAELGAALAPLGTRTSERALERLSPRGMLAVSWTQTAVATSPPASSPFASTIVSDRYRGTLRQRPAELRAFHELPATPSAAPQRALESKTAIPRWLRGTGLALLVATALGVGGLCMYTALKWRTAPRPGMRPTTNGSTSSPQDALLGRF